MYHTFFQASQVLLNINIFYCHQIMCVLCQVTRLSRQVYLRTIQYIKSFIMCHQSTAAYFKAHHHYSIWSIG